MNGSTKENDSPGNKGRYSTAYRPLQTVKYRCSQQPWVWTSISRIMSPQYLKNTGVSLWFEIVTVTVSPFVYVGCSVRATRSGIAGLVSASSQPVRRTAASRTAGVHIGNRPLPSVKLSLARLGAKGALRSHHRRGEGEFLGKCSSAVLARDRPPRGAVVHVQPLVFLPHAPAVFARRLQDECIGKQCGCVGSEDEK